MNVAPLALGLMLVGCSSDGLSRIESTLETRHEDAGACAPADGGARGACDERDAAAARVYDCRWEWADDPCPDAGPPPVVDGVGPAARARRAAVVRP